MGNHAMIKDLFGLDQITANGDARAVHHLSYGKWEQKKRNNWHKTKHIPVFLLIRWGTFDKIAL